MDLDEASFDLSRFVQAQDTCFEHVMEELTRGRKRSHWMWFVFPQVTGLGRTTQAEYYAIHSKAEARAYLQHAELGPRLVSATEITLTHMQKSAERIFGQPDVLKFRSSMTLFETISEQPCFSLALDQFYQGERDERTLDILKSL